MISLKTFAEKRLKVDIDDNGIIRIDTEKAAAVIIDLMKQLGEITSDLINSGLEWKQAYTILKKQVMEIFELEELPAANFVRLCMNFESVRLTGKPLYPAEDCRMIVDSVFNSGK